MKSDITPREKSTNRTFAFLILCGYVLTGVALVGLIKISHRVSDIETNYYSTRPANVAVTDQPNLPSYNYGSEITMPHQNRIYDMLMDIDNLTDTTKELISQAWSKKDKNLTLSISTVFDEGSIISLSLKLPDGSYLTARIQWDRLVKGWTLIFWDRITPEN